MGLRRCVTTLSILTAAGIYLSRPDFLMPISVHFIVPLSAQQAQAVNSLETALPNFLPGNQALSFKPSDKAALEPVAAAAAPPAPSISATAVPVTAPPTASSSEPVTASPPPLPANTTTAAINPVRDSAPPTGEPPPPQTPQQTVTIEPDPTLTPAPVPQKPLVPAKSLFGVAKKPAPLAARAIGSYSRGCLAGAEALSVDGPAWQAMRLSRNRNWGHPALIKMVERLALESQKEDAWPGLLVGDISQPRGGPMLTGHASHQVGLDADVWLTPMPSKRLSRKEREELSATSMLDSTDIAIDPTVFTDGQVKLIKRAASYREVERVLVHPAIKKALCERAGPDRGWLGKVRPIGGHYYHFHIRIGCPSGSATCAPQKPVTGDDGCGKEVQEWLARLTPSKVPPVPKPPGWKPRAPAPPITLAQLPQECTAVLESGPDGVDIPASEKLELKAIADAPASLKPHLRKIRAANH